jgi:alpha-ketoglutaric semialdehyde dehydrogenase
MPIQGKNFIGYRLSAKGTHQFQSYVPNQDTQLPESFFAANSEEINEALTLANEAFLPFSSLEPSKRAAFLRAICDEILKLGDELLDRAHLETGLPMARLQGERARTLGQLSQFADLIEEGSWVAPSIDTAIPDRSPVPKPDLRKKQVPLGPVVVFGSSNFPFAYSVAGVDTGPALAAGNPVIVKAHPAHPGVSDLTAQAIVAAARSTEMPEGVFSMLYDDGYQVGTELVKHPITKAVGFTGSLKGGMALYKLGQEREEPIPVFAEMGSVNPIVLLPETLAKKAESIAKSLAGSVTLGVGQFCTNPGLVFVVKSESTPVFEAAYRHEIEKSPQATMLTKGICQNYQRLVSEASAQEGATLLAKTQLLPTAQNQAEATILKTTGKVFINNPSLHEEIFGPFSLLVEFDTIDELKQAVRQLKGQLTVSLFADPAEAAAHPDLLQQLSLKGGRFIMNGVPTGVEVCPSMHHGGPFPSATDSRFTSVGRDAIYRFTRPQSFQDWDDTLLPLELQNSNPLGILRLVNNQWTRDAVTV